MTAKWRTCLLGEVVNLKRGYDLPSQHRVLGDVPIVSSSGVTDYHNVAKVKGPGVVTGRYGTLGAVHFVDVDFWPLNTSLYVQDFKGNDPRFIAYFLGALNLGTQVSAAAVPGVNRNHLHAMTVAVPCVCEQRRIAGILSAYDDLIENCQRRIKILDEMARRLYREWFVHFRYTGHESIPLVDSPLGPIPQGWEVKGVKDVAQVTYGFAFKSQQFNTDGIGTPIVRIRDIPKGKAETYTDEEAHPKYHIRDGHILVGMDGDFHMCVWSAGPALQVQRVARFEPTGAVGNHLLYLLLERPIQELNKSIVGTTVAHLGDSHIKEIKVAIPPAAMLSCINAALDPILEQVTVLKKSIATLRRTRDLLLPRLLGGA
ncbi:MAG: restriction endonuclease subunit S [Armatimonadetes bacterium]|nr:restriction endonuclease subunit S [Armatimonadota bacterium]